MRDRNAFLITNSAPSPGQKSFAMVLVVVLGVACALTAPHARTPLSHTEVFLPAYAAATLINEVVTSVLIFALYLVQPSRAVLALGAGYLFAGLSVLPWAASFPGVFDALGFQPGLQGTAFVAAIRRLSFPVFLIAYALLKDRPSDRLPGGGRAPGKSILVSAALVCGGTALLTWAAFMGDAWLPRLMQDTRNVAGLWEFVPPTALVLYALAGALLWLRRRSVLDLWLLVVLVTLVIEILLLSYLAGGTRLSVGWWAGRLYGLVSASTVLAALLVETTILYGRVARSVLQEHQQRDARLSALEALSAMIAHEVNQPIASMVTNADAGMRWLDREAPAAPETRAALGRIVRDGHRAGEVVRSVRAMFGAATQQREELNLEALIRDVLARFREEAWLLRITMTVHVAEDLPPVMGCATQLQQVLVNLLSNAVDALRNEPAPWRGVEVEAQRGPDATVVVSVADSGPGLAPDQAARIFTPFVSTKPHGMGMGLMVCRTAVESHGGRIWVEDRMPRGTVFRFTLPVRPRTEDRIGV